MGLGFMATKNFLFGYIVRMARPRTTFLVTAQQLHVLAQQLADWAERLQQAAEIAEQQDPPGLAIYNWLSVSKGLQLLGSFVEKADQSKMQASLGKPLTPGQPRPRSVKQVAEPDTEYRKGTE